MRWGGTGWFDEDVLWLAPDPDAPFRALTAAVFRAFPDYPPYQGEYTDLVPHLTVGSTGTSDDLRAAERAVLPHLPITSEVTHVQLMCGSPTAGSWRILHDIPLGGGCAAGSTPV